MTLNEELEYWKNLAVQLGDERDELIADRERWSLEVMDAAKIAFECSAQVATLKSALRDLIVVTKHLKPCPGTLAKAIAALETNGVQ